MSYNVKVHIKRTDGTISVVGGDSYTFGAEIIDLSSKYPEASIESVRVEVIPNGY